MSRLDQASNESSQESPQVPYRPFDIKTMGRLDRRSRHILGASWLAIGGAQLLLGVVTSWTFVAPVLLFWIVAIGAGLCAVLSAAVIVRALRQSAPEPALFGTFLFGASLLPFVHGLLVPGVLYGDNAGTVLAVQLAIPLSAPVLLPLVQPGSSWANRVARSWRLLIAAELSVLSLAAVLLFSFPNAVPAASSGSLPAFILAALSVGPALALSVRHTRLASIARTPAAFGVPLGIVLIGSAPLVFVAGEMFGAGFWFAHAIDITGVLFAATAAILTYGRTTSMEHLLAPVEAATPLRALEIGLEPVVHAFVADLERKDTITRDHVVRTARLAVLAAQELGCAPAEVRAIGIGALLHDVGKIEIPDHILKKAGKLTDDEFDTMKTHPVIGEQLVASSPALNEAAPIIRGHHERIDGRGYPDQLEGSDIPLGARVVAVCDAFDAMANTRQYRTGMGRDKAESILAEHAGVQWDQQVVAAVRSVLDQHLSNDASPALDRVGREHAGGESDGAPLSDSMIRETVVCCDDHADLVALAQ